jgi:membrane protein DedA with SNARE-associated domain
MNAAQAILATAGVLAQEVYEQPAPARTAFPWFWVIIALIVAVALVWYFSARARGGPPTTRP